jgi:hypothetical protein
VENARLMHLRQPGQADERSLHSFEELLNVLGC